MNTNEIAILVIVGLGGSGLGWLVSTWIANREIKRYMAERKAWTEKYVAELRARYLPTEEVSR